LEIIKDGYTRVTEVLSQYSGLGNIDPTVLHNAAQRGTKVHKYCELHATGEYFPEPPVEIKGYVDSFIQWFDEMVEEIVDTERRFYSEAYRISGAVDLIAKLNGDGQLTVIDYKTPANPSKTWALQTAAYKMLAEETGLEITRRLAVMLRKDGSFPKVVEYTDYSRDWRLYKGILEAWRYFND